jgi:hypothetical protein
VAGPPGGGVGFAEVESIASRHGAYLIMRASSTSWAAEVAWHECIRLCSGDASWCRWVASFLFIGIVGSLSWLLVRRFLLPGGLRTVFRTSWISYSTWESYIIISSIVVEAVAVSGEGGMVVAMFSSSFFVRVSTAALC